MKVNWDDEIPNISGKIQNVPNHQPELVVVFVQENPTQVWKKKDDEHRTTRKLVENLRDSKCEIYEDSLTFGKHGEHM